MKIALIQPRGKEAGHSTEYTLNLAKHIQYFKNTVRIITFDGLLSDDKDIEIVKTKGYLPKFTSYGNNLISYFLYKYATRSKKNKDYYSENIFYWLCDNAKCFDAIVFIDGIAPSKLFFLCIYINLPIVIMIETYMDIKLAGKLKILNKVWLWFLRNKLKSRRIAWVFFTMKEREWIETTLEGSRILRMPLWPVLSRRAINVLKAKEKIGLPNDSKVYLVYGVNHSSKDYRNIFEAFQKLEDKSTYLIIAGKILEEVVKNNDIYRLWGYLEADYKNRVLIINEYVDEEKELLFFSASRACIISYIEGFNFASGTVSKAFEYNKPVICSNTPSTLFVKNNNLGLIFKSSNTNSLKNVWDCFNKYNENEIKMIKQNISKYKLSNTWFQASSKILNLICSCRESQN